MKYIFYIILFASAGLNAQTDSLKTDTQNTNIVEISKILGLAESHMGTPYRYGGCEPGGFDCSGFVKYCFESSMDISLPHISGEIANMGVPVSRAEARPGDIVAFAGRSVNGNVGHVGIVYEVTNDAVYFIHSSTSQGVRIDRVKSNYWERRFLGIRRIRE